MANKNTYETKEIVKRYSTQDYLLKPEKTMLDMFKTKFKNMSMLDIGVGGGRTTQYFAQLTKEYVGIDYSKKMIDVCNKRFPKHSKKISFRLCDVRYMDMFNDNHFDLIFISENGLDYISHEDRLNALREIKRVGKKGGFFYFSTHNLQTIDKLLSIKLSLHPSTIARNIVRYLLLRLLNKNFKELKNKKYTTMNDGAHQFRLSTYYIKPLEQVKQLSSLGFKNVRVYSLKNGKEIIKKTDIYKTSDGLHHGLYYLCNT